MPKTIDKYTIERNDILQKLLNILEISDTNKTFSLKNLDENETKQKLIIELESDIKKYFLCSRWTYFSNKNREFKRSYLSLIKAIMKDLNIKMNSSTLIKKTDDNKTKCETFYIFDI
jgi:hypothetical protein